MLTDTQLTTVAAGASAFAAHQRLLRHRDQAEQSFVAMAVELAVIRRERWYVALGYATFAEYVSQPELGIGVQHAYRLAQVGETFAPRLLGGEAQTLGAQLARIGIAKAAIIAPLVKAGEEDADLLDEAEQLSVRDLYRAVAVRRGAPDTLECEEYVALGHQLAAVARRLCDEPTREGALAILDDLGQRTIAARARLETTR